MKVKNTQKETEKETVEIVRTNQDSHDVQTNNNELTSEVVPHEKVSSNSNSTLLHYWNLSSIVEENRISAANDLINDLSMEIAAFPLIPCPFDPSVASDGPAIAIIKAAGAFPENVAYALKRLVRGLSSSRDGARLGFATALKELLALLPHLPVGLFLRHLHETSEKNGKKPGQEERDYYFARIFGYYAMTLSGMLTSTCDVATTTATLQDIELMVDILLECCKEKDYLRVVSTFCALEILKSIQSHPTLAAALSNAIVTKWLAQGVTTPEQAWFAIESRVIYPEFSSWSALLGDWKHSDILYSKNKSKLLDLLKSASFYHQSQSQTPPSPPPSPSSSSILNAAAGEASLHPLFKAIVDGLHQPTEKKRLSLVEFWCLIEPFFFATHSYDRKSMGFHFLTNLVLPNCLPGQVSLVMTKLFMRCFINSLSSSDTKLFKQARFTTGVLTAQAQQTPSLALPLVSALIGVNGHFKFDQITKTKTVESLLAVASPDDVYGHMNHLIDVFSTPSTLTPRAAGETEGVEDERGVEGIRLWVVDQVYLLLKTGKIKKTQATVEAGLEWLVQVAFYTPASIATETVQKSAAEKVVQILSTLANLRTVDQEVDVDWTSRLHSIVLASSHKPAHAKTNPASLSKSAEMVHKITTEHPSISKPEQTAFKRLFETLGVVFFADQDAGTDTLHDLEECIANMTATGKRKRDVEVRPVEVLVDVLISFLAKPSAVLRSLAVDSFKAFAAKSGTRAVMDLFVQVLSVDGGVQGAQELFEEQEEAGDDVVSEQESSDSDSGDEDAENAMPVDEELRAKIQAALEMDVEQNLEDLGDDEMENFDSKLAEIFSQRKSIKNVKKESKETVLHFKLRVLDLFDLFLKANATSPLFIASIEPLLELYQSTSNSMDSLLLHNKLKSMIKSRMVHCKEVVVLDDACRAECFQTLESILGLCRKVNDSDGIFSGLCMTVVKSLAHSSNNVTITQSPTPNAEPKKKKKKTKEVDVSNEEATSPPQQTTIEKIVAIYQSAFKHWMTVKNTKIKPSLFTDFSSRYPLICLDLVPAMLEATLSVHEPKSFQAVKTFEMVAVVIKNSPKPVSEEKEAALIELAKKYTDALGKTLEKAGDVGDKGPYGMPKDRIKTLLKSFGAVLRKVKTVSSEKWASDSFEKILEAVSEHERFKCAAVTSLVKQTILLMK